MTTTFHLKWHVSISMRLLSSNQARMHELSSLDSVRSDPAHIGIWWAQPHPMVVKAWILIGSDRSADSHLGTMWVYYWCHHENHAPCLHWARNAACVKATTDILHWRWMEISRGVHPRLNICWRYGQIPQTRLKYIQVQVVQNQTRSPNIVKCDACIEHSRGTLLHQCSVMY